MEARWLRCRYISEGIYHLTAPANDSAARAGHILFICGSDSARVDITQAPGKHLSLTPDTLTFSHRGGKETLSITCYTPWRISSKSEWVETDIANGDGPQNVPIKVSPNESTEEMSGTITFEESLYKKTCQTIHQTRQRVRTDRWRRRLYNITLPLQLPSGGSQPHTLDPHSQSRHIIPHYIYRGIEKYGV